MSHLYVVSIPSLYIAPSPAPDNFKKQAKLLHWDVPLLPLTTDCNHSLLQVVVPSAIIERSRSVYPDKLKKVSKTLINLPDLKVLQAMLLTRFSDKEVANLSLRFFIRRSLPGKTVKGLEAHVLGPLLPPPPQSVCSERFHNCAIDDAAIHIEEGSPFTGVGACDQAIAVTPSPLPPLLLALARP
jgi:hypothetical protein